jgi:peptidylprolyl isomerase
MADNTGKLASVTYTGTLDDGSIFDSSEGRPPLQFVVGGGQVIPGFDRAVADLDVDGSTTVVIEPADAYGEIVDEAIQTAPRAIFGDEEPPVGEMIMLQAEDGSQLAATVVSFTDDEVTFDFNHPLAGKRLTFDITLVGVEDAPAGGGCSCSPSQVESCGCDPETGCS